MCYELSKDVEIYPVKCPKIRKRCEIEKKRDSLLVRELE